MKGPCILLSLLSLFLMAKGNMIIESPHQTNWGIWGSWARCPFGRYVQAIQLRTEEYQGAFTDDSAVNGIRLYCGDPYNASTTYIASMEGNYGNWGQVFPCRSDGRPIPPDGYVTGFQLRVEGPLSVGDDTATNNVLIYCNYPNLGISEQSREADGLTFGSWTESRKCNSFQSVCALQTQVEIEQSSDITSLNNVRMECCDM